MGFFDIKAGIGKRLLDLYLTKTGKAMGVTSHVFHGDIDILWDEIQYPDTETLVFLHGFSDRKESFYLTAKALAGRFSIVMPELPGFGRSRRYPDLRHDLPAYEGWLQSLVETLAPERVHLVGNSLGGLICARLAMAIPHRVKSLTLVNSAGFFLEPHNRFYHDFFQGNCPFLIHTPADYDRFRKRVFFRQGNLPFGVSEYLAKQMMVNREWYLKILSDTFSEISLEDFMKNHPEADLTGQLEKIPVPVNLIWGKEDTFFPFAMAEHVHRSVSTSRLCSLENTGHCPHLENPPGFARALGEILSTG